MDDVGDVSIDMTRMSLQMSTPCGMRLDKQHFDKKRNESYFHVAAKFEFLTQKLM